MLNLIIWTWFFKLDYRILGSWTLFESDSGLKVRIKSFRRTHPAHSHSWLDVCFDRFWLPPFIHFCQKSFGYWTDKCCMNRFYKRLFKQKKSFEYEKYFESMFPNQPSVLCAMGLSFKTSLNYIISISVDKTLILETVFRWSTCSC